MDEGYTIYFVRGNFPAEIPVTQRSITGDGTWVRVLGDDEEDLKLALEASLANSGFTPSINNNINNRYFNLF